MRRRRSEHPRSNVPTLATVAAEAGVSPATVSRVVNSSAPVSEEHRVAVEAAVARLGYVPNRAARSLATRRTGAVALVVRESVSFGVSDPYISQCIVAASQSLTGSGLHLVVMVAQDDAEHESVSSYVRSGHVDGVILLSVHAGDPLPRQLFEAGIPVVMGGRPADDLPGICYVDTDNIGGARLAARRLLETGRRSIAVVSGPQDMSAAADRLKGFRAELADAGVDLGPVAYGAFTRASGEKAMIEVLERDASVDAVFAASDTMAAGVLRALHMAGRRVPDDVAVIGFDDVELAEYTDPPLTTVRQAANEQARTMVACLLSQVRDKVRPEPVMMPTTLVVRASA